MSDAKRHLKDDFGIALLPKGQIISEQNCGVLNFPKMQRIIARISALGSKMGQNKKGTLLD